MPTSNRHLQRCNMPIELLYHDVGKQCTAFSTTRSGGVSKGSYSSMNITHYCGDDADAVAQNRILLARTIGIKQENIILPRQTHGVESIAIDEDFLQLDAEAKQQRLDSVDAIMTNLSGICIGVSTADCIPLLLHDEGKGVVAAIHAGWRGTAADIVSRTIDAMRSRYGTHPEDIRATIAPGISLEAFEVGDEVYDVFAKLFDADAIARRYNGRWHIDLWESNRLLLLKNGVKKENIAIAGICTYQNCDRFFSARRLGTASGRIFNGIVKKLK